MLFLSLILYFLLQFKYSLNGHIYSWDMTLNYNNAGFVTEFTMPFSLENSLDSTDYFKIVFPFSLHTTTTVVADAVIPGDIKVTYAKASYFFFIQ